MACARLNGAALDRVLHCIEATGYQGQPHLSGKQELAEVELADAAIVEDHPARLPPRRRQQRRHVVARRVAAKVHAAEGAALLQPLQVARLQLSGRQETGWG